MMYTKRPNHIGVQLGEVISYSPNKCHIKIKLNRELNLGDSIAIREASCRISELMQQNNNIKSANIGQIVTIGRLKGNIKEGDIVYKTVSIKLNQDTDQKLNKENIKRNINCFMKLKQGEAIILEVQDIATNIKVKIQSNNIAEKANTNGITKQRIEEQLSKTGNTIFRIETINLQLDENIIVPISTINEIRRNALEELEIRIKQSFIRKETKVQMESKICKQETTKNPEVTIVLNQISKNIEYSNIEDVDNIYIPFKFFINRELESTIEKILKKFNTYVLLPAITKSNYEKLIDNNLLEIAQKVKGIVVSNLSQIYRIKELEIDKELIANYTMNIENNYTIEELNKFGISRYTVPPEAEKETIQNLSSNIKKEIIVYGRTLLMTTEYCSIGTLKNCQALCEKGRYTLKDRMGFEFPIYTDRINCNNLIYNSKITSISYKELNTDSIRIDILQENEEEIQNIINTHKRGDRLEGQNYTNGNLNREI